MPDKEKQPGADHAKKNPQDKTTQPQEQEKQYGNQTAGAADKKNAHPDQSNLSNKETEKPV